uniref:Chorein N-terminal domain-containing protein n=1 Tax=Ascaris lumbricoides TaxID=6252 RepID=A0A9J2PBS5_ASCLU
MNADSLTMKCFIEKTMKTTSGDSGGIKIPMWVDSRIGSIELEKLNVIVDNYTNSYILIPWSSISKLPKFSLITEPRFFAREALCQHFGYELPSVRRKEDVKLLEGAVQADLCIAITKFVLCVRHIISSTVHTTTLQSNESQETTAALKQLQMVTLLGEQLELTPSPNTTNMSAGEASASPSDKTRNKITPIIIFFCFFILTL